MSSNPERDSWHGPFGVTVAKGFVTLHCKILHSLYYTYTVEYPRGFVTITGWPMSSVKTSCWLSSDSFGSCWAATVATYCPGRITELSKPKSTGGVHRRDGSPCRSPSWDIGLLGVWLNLFWVGSFLSGPPSQLQMASYNCALSNEAGLSIFHF